MTIGTPPFRIKLTKVDQEMVEHYNRSSFHRNELLIPVRPFTLALGDKKIEVSSRQIIILPEPISRKIFYQLRILMRKMIVGTVDVMKNCMPIFWL